ncbi:hypothetical protein N0V83_003511 [Neocucurbitaria cava]|uniref:Uncharacterized protein n=1 Tax=Neocucurbitaria cava TaxID=798079 RepID=A0A9W8YB95_9PLEO|nr:hypothetical protein N0V83_003511 [Neocucurbitaria cava]
MTADNMDLHSDDEIDFGDGDLDLDLEAAPSPRRQDEDVSIKDAASVGGNDVQAVPTEEDDFMADHEDLFEEGYRNEGEVGDGIVAADQSSTNNNALADQYDDVEEGYRNEGETGDGMVAAGQSSADKNVSADQYDDIEFDYYDDDGVLGEQKVESYTYEGQDAQDEAVPVNPDGVQDHDQAHQAADDEGVPVEGHADGQSDHHSDTHNEEGDHTDGGDGGVQLYGHEDLADEDEYEGSEHEVPHEDSDPATDAADNDDEDDQSFNLPPVTVNYTGNELWLFKEHDTDDSGDWLLEGLYLANKSMSELFHACRSSLGDDVSNEHEIGFRFDHLHGLELYEEHVASVAVKLHRLVGLYHTLQEQDGNNEPDSFYMTLLFRPRFMTFLSDIGKCAEQGIGYSGLEAAVATGETHFSNLNTGSSTEHESNEWENEEQREADYGDAEQTEGLLQEEVEHVEQESQAHTASDADYNQEVDDEHDSANTSNVPTTQQDSVGQLDAQISLAQSVNTTASDARREQEQDDLIDYSDDEGPEVTEQVTHASVNDQSVSSSTVQGDESTAVEEGANTTHDLDHNHHGIEHNDEGVLYAEDEHDNQFNDQLQEGIDDTTQSYQDYDDQAFGQDDLFQDFQANGDANQDYAGTEYNDLDQQQIDFLSGADLNAGDHDLTNANEFFDLTNASQPATDQGPASKIHEDDLIAYEDTTAQVDEEDGTADQSAAAVSSNANPTAASSTGLQDSSSRGQKRSVAEAGHGVEDALESIGMVVYLWRFKRTCNVDSLLLPDAKRPKT